MGKRYGFVTPGDMYAYYYNTEWVRFLVVITAFLYATFYSALQLTAGRRPFSLCHRRPLGVRRHFHGLYRLVLHLHRRIAGLHLGGGDPVRASGFRHCHPGGLCIGPFRRVDQLFLGDRQAGVQIPGSARAHQLHGGTAGMDHGDDFVLYVRLMGIQSSPAFTMWTFGIKSPSPGLAARLHVHIRCGIRPVFFTAFQGMGAIVLQKTGVLALASDRDVVPILMKNYLPPVMLAWSSSGQSPPCIPPPPRISAPAAPFCSGTSGGGMCANRSAATPSRSG